MGKPTFSGVTFYSSLYPIFWDNPSSFIRIILQYHITYEALSNIFEISRPKTARMGGLVKVCYGSSKIDLHACDHFMQTNFLGGLAGTRFNGINLIDTVDGDHTCTMFVLA